MSEEQTKKFPRAIYKIEDAGFDVVHDVALGPGDCVDHDGSCHNLKHLAPVCKGSWLDQLGGLRCGCELEQA